MVMRANRGATAGRVSMENSGSGHEAPPAPAGLPRWLSACLSVSPLSYLSSSADREPGPVAVWHPIGFVSVRI